MDVICSALSQHNIDTSSLAMSLYSRRLSIGLLASVKILDIVCNVLLAFSALTLLVGVRKEHPACKKID